MTTGMAGFRQRPFEDNDPLVCGCGVTIGTQTLTKNKRKLQQVQDEHEPEHLRRMAHQSFHRGPATDCPECP